MCLPITVSKISALSCFGVAVDLKVKVMITTESKFLSKHRIKYYIVTVTFKVIQSKKVMVPNKREYTSSYLSIIATFIIMCLYCSLHAIL